MAIVTVTGLTAARMEAMEDDQVISGAISGDNLILTKRGGATVNAGNVRGPQGPYGAPPLVSTLPPAPANGDEVYFQDASMATNGIIWHLRYRSGASGSYKWEVVSAGPLIDGIASEVNKTVAVALTYYDFSAPISIDVPLAGDYLIRVSGNRVQANTTYSAVYASLSATSGSFPYGNNDQAYAGMGSQYEEAPFAIIQSINGISAGGSIRLRYTHTATGSQVNYINVVMTIEPIRVG